MLNIDFLNNDYSDSRTPAEKAREQIKAAILSRELKPGQRLIEQKLCEQYSLSRPPLRERHPFHEEPPLSSGGALGA